MAVGREYVRDCGDYVSRTVYGVARWGTGRVWHSSPREYRTYKTGDNAGIEKGYGAFVWCYGNQGGRRLNNWQATGEITCQRCKPL